MKVVTRFPPSPTGYFHIGGARTALFNYLFTAHEGGIMYLRFEDTDKTRSKKEYEDDILAGLDWLGITYMKAEPLRQSERLEAYRAYLHALIEKGAAYEAEEGEKGGSVVRFKNPNVRVTFTDLIRGEVSFDTTELKDFVIARNVNDPLYHMSVVADDSDMGITHVIRGEDHISNTQRQILILEALGFERPVYAHIPLILAPDKTKLSKRHGAASVNEYRELGFEPEALFNYLALLGWTPPRGVEKLSREELIAEFDIKDVHKSGAVFDIEKLKWLNRQYILEAADERMREEAEQRIPHQDKATIARLLPLLRERIQVWSDIDAMARHGELDFFFIEPKLDPANIAGKGSDARVALRHLEATRKLLEALPSARDIDATDVKNAVWAYAEKEGRGPVLWPLRYALTGRQKSPDPFVVAAILGRELTLRRIDVAIQTLKVLP
ncbi:glutamate--tRNA ligase [Candidatus Kaiserbacteria bacterium]|nr:glutamate--tRNA ligase [Candidatus Kaiserbacteria bacterium]